MDATSNQKYGALLLNMGGPASLEQIQPYLFELFSDPFIIQLPLAEFFRNGSRNSFPPEERGKSASVTRPLAESRRF